MSNTPHLPPDDEPTYGLLAIALGMLVVLTLGIAWWWSAAAPDPAVSASVTEPRAESPSP